MVTLNPEEQKTTMVSIPRDTFPEIVGNDSYDKITHAYWYGGAEIAINTVQKMLDIPIDYYIFVDMAGIQKIVDAVGGIDVAIDQAFKSNGIAYAEGLNRLDGAAALKNSRIRNDQTEQDTGRQARQRRVIQAIANKVLTMGTLWNNQKLLQTFVANVETNFQTANYLNLERYGYVAATKNIKQEALGGVGGLRQDRGLLACGR